MFLAVETHGLRLLTNDEMVRTQHDGTMHSSDAICSNSFLLTVEPTGEIFMPAQQRKTSTPEEKQIPEQMKRQYKC
jgi:hypothetical protein